MSTYHVRTTHGKTRLRAKRSFGPVPVAVELNELDAALVLADPFLQVVLVDAQAAEPDTAEPDAAGPDAVRAEPVEAALRQAQGERQNQAKPTKKAKA